MNKFKNLLVALLSVIFITGAIAGGFPLLHVGSADGNSGNVLWTPLNLSSTVAWWDANQGITFGSNPSVASWTDVKSGIVASQSTAINQPTFNATARNGKAGLAFNSVQSFSFPVTSIPVGSTSRFIGLAGYNVSSAKWEFGYGTAANGQWVGINNASAALGGSVEGNIFGTAISSTTSWTNVDGFVGFSVATGAQQLWFNGTSLGTSAAAVNTVASIAYIGAAPNGTTLFTGFIQQVVITNALLSTSDRQKLEGWESWYDGKSGTNLPASNPYSSTGTLNRAPYVSDP